MKKYIAPLALLAAFGLGSCSEEFEVTAPYKDITVVYGMLNPADTAHYIRIQKAFLDEHKSAIDMSKSADSNYYQNIRVDIKQLNNAGNVISVIPNIQRVNLDFEGYPKQPGAFFTAPNYAYKFKEALNPASRYRLVITNLSTGNVDSAETNIITNNPNDFQVPQFLATNLVVNFSKTENNVGFALTLASNPANARVVEGIIRFHYVDKNVQTGVQTDQSVDWRFATKVLDNSSSSALSTVNRAFYTFLGGAIPQQPANIERYMDSCDVYVWAANDAFYNYQQASLAANGITGDQVKPIYTNVKGKNALGLFAARSYVARLEVPITSSSVDSMRLNPATSFLNFKGLSDH